MDEKPVVKIFDDRHLNEMKRTEKKSSKKKTPSITYEENQRVRWEKGGKYNYGEVIKDKGKRVVIKPDEGGKVLVEKKYIEIVEEGEPEPEKEAQEEEVEEKPVINYYSGSKEYGWLSSFNKAKPFDYEGDLTLPLNMLSTLKKLKKDRPLRDEYQNRIANEIDPLEAKKTWIKKEF